MTEASEGVNPKKSVREFLAEDRTYYRWIIQGGLANLDCFVPIDKNATDHLHMRMSIRDMQRLLGFLRKSARMPWGDVKPKPVLKQP